MAEKQPLPYDETVTILGKEYIIRYTDSIGTCGNMGSADRSKQFIAVDAGLAPQQVESTVLHEIIHMVDRELKLDLPEETVCRLEVGLYSAGYRRTGGYHG
jgi:hypothetical protein